MKNNKYLSPFNGKEVARSTFYRHKNKTNIESIRKRIRFEDDTPEFLVEEENVVHENNNNEAETENLDEIEDDSTYNTFEKNMDNYYLFFKSILEDDNVNNCSGDIPPPNNRVNWDDNFFEGDINRITIMVFVIKMSIVHRCSHSILDSVLQLIHDIFPGCILPKQYKTILEWMKRLGVKEVSVNYCSNCHEHIYINELQCVKCKEKEKKTYIYTTIGV